MSIAETDFLCHSTVARKKELLSFVCVITTTAQSGGRARMCVYYNQQTIQRISIKFGITVSALKLYGRIYITVDEAQM
jgi:hypothetical protein